MPRHAPTIALDPETSSALNRLVKLPSTPQSLAVRGRIVLAAAQGRSNQQIAAELDLPEITVSKWRRSFAKFGIEGLRDKARSGRPRKHDEGVWHQVQTRACQQPESQSRWTVRTLAASWDCRTVRYT